MSNVKQREKFIKIFPQRQVFLNSWRGPDRPNGKIMDLVRHMKFSLNNMDPEGKLSFLALRRRNISGKEKILRVNDIDNIWVWSDKQHRLYIVFIDAPTEIYYAIRVSVNKNAYVFSDLIADFSDKDISISGSYDEKREYCPYIYQLGDKSFAEIGVIHSDIASTWDEWHYKWYTFDCAPSSGSYNSNIEIWRPATQGFRKAFGYDLDPTWYSMSYFTAYSKYSKWSRVIDHAKRVYQPLTTTVELTDAAYYQLPLISKSGNIYTFGQPVTVMNYYGKNAFTIDAKEDIVTYGASAKIDKAVDVECPVDIQPALYFWPWIPYLDDIGHFDIFTYAERTTFGMSEGFFITPELDSFKSWEVKYYNLNGADQVVNAYADSGTFSDMPGTSNTVEDSENPPCEGWGGTWQCGLLEYEHTVTTTTGPYTSHGSRVIPLGVTGLDMIRMETSWTQSGSMQSMTSYKHNVSGNYPYTYEMRPEYVYGKEYYHDLFGPYVFKNVVDSTVDKTENYANTMSLSQDLYIGDDVIFSGGGALTYSATHTIHQKRDAEIFLELESTCVDASISYTTDTLYNNESETLSVDGYDANNTYTWKVLGDGSLSDTEGESVTYTAPGEIPECIKGDWVELYCNDVLVDTLSLTLKSLFLSEGGGAGCQAFVQQAGGAQIGCSFIKGPGTYDEFASISDACQAVRVYTDGIWPRWTNYCCLIGTCYAGDGGSCLTAKGWRIHVDAPHEVYCWFAKYGHCTPKEGSCY